MNFKYFFIFCVALLALFGCNQGDISRVGYIEIKNQNNLQEFQGIIKAQDSSILSFQSEGRINFFPYTKGDFIKKGQVIARVDGILYLIKKNEEQARLHELNVQYNKQKAYYSRLDILHNEGAISDNDWESAFFELQALEEEIKVQKEKIKYIDKEISYNALLAPYDGYIGNKFLGLNSYAKIGAPVLEFNSLEGLQVEFFVGEKDINNIKNDENIVVDIINTNYPAKIAHISKTSLNSGGYLIKANLLKNTQLLKEGMSASVKLLANHKNLKQNEQFLPITSIFKEDNKNYIYKIEPRTSKIGVVKKVEISTGEISGNKVFITKGLKEKDLVVLNHFDIVCENQKVKL